MLTKCKTAKYESRAFERTFYHEIWMRIRWRMQIWNFMNFHEFAWILHVFVWKFSIFAKMQKFLHIELYISQWGFVQNTCKVVRWKALDPYFSLLHFVSIYEHLASIYGHMYDINKNAVFHDIFAFVVQKCSYLLGKCSGMLIKCKNAKSDARAIQRISYRINWTKTRWERMFRIQTQMYSKTALLLYIPAKVAALL